MKRLLVLLPVAAALTTAPAASAADIVVDQPCVLSGATVGVGGSGWTPGAAWSLTGAVQAQATVAADGTVTTPVTVPKLPRTQRTPQTFPLQASDGAQSAAGELLVVRPGAIWADEGNPRKEVRWTFGGMAPDEPIYVHVRRNGRTLKTTRVGVAAAPCGTATKRLRRLPLRPSQIRDGNYRIVVNSRRSAGAGAGVQYSYTYGVKTRPRR